MSVIEAMRINDAAISTASPSARLGHVAIIGGGIGGLTLAQGLRKAGISVAVYERDLTPTDRVQGYRVHINPTGSRALHACLPPRLFDQFARSCGRPSRAIKFLTEQMGVLLSVGDDLVPQTDPIGKHRSVSRTSLRQVLLEGLEGTVHFGKAFVRYEECDQGVVAHFADGATAEGNILVAADGGSSRVRRQLSPHAERIDTGVIGIAGKVFLDDGNRGHIAPELLEGMSLVSAKGGYSLFIALQEVDSAASKRSRDRGIDGADDPHFDDTRSYLMWALGAQRQKFGLNGNADALRGEPLRAIALEAMAGWDDRFKALVRLADADTINVLAIRTSRPVAPWHTQRVTLLGDAIHSMTPYRGIGANIALKDAARLRDALCSVDRGAAPLIDALGGYETGMIDYGFKAVHESLRAMEQAMSDSAATRIISRTAFCAINHMPPIKRWFAARLGNE
jgi:2-polyprenyl-6-methoxyphenol hydroxylase-like FAD-dependent oxidoreductase